MTFLAPGIPGQDVVEPLDAAPSFVDETCPAVFVFLAERTSELGLVQEAFPGGHLLNFYDASDRLRFTAYEVQP